jgi:hypothetical protein
MTDEQIAKALGWPTWKPASDGPDDLVNRIRRLVAAAVAAERERCAQECEDIAEQADESWDVYADPNDQGRAIGAGECAAAIRALD